MFNVARNKIAKWNYSKNLGFRWSYKLSNGKTKLTKRAKEHLSDNRKNKQKEQFERLERTVGTFRKYTYFIKTIYDSPRGSSYDFFFEGKLEWISDSEPTIFEVEAKIKEMVERRQFKTNTAICDFIDNFDLDEMEIGQISDESESTNEKEEKTELEIIKYGYHI